MRRRDFVIALGAGAGASITGYFYFRQPPAPNSVGGSPDAGESEFQPCLADDVTFDRQDGQVTISRGEGDNAVVCAVNPLGAAIIDRLDGEHTVEQIAAALATQLVEPLERPLDAKVALFTAQLAECGFLANHFYATIYEAMDVE